jgi:hypothetical protein
MTGPEPLVFPIGQNGGCFRRDAGADWRFAVRRGTEVTTLSGHQYLMWLAAHGSTARVGETTWTRAAVLALARDFELPDPEATYAEMLDLRLIAEAEPEGPAAVAFASGHQLLPLTHSLGNTPEEPDWYGLGFPPKPWVSVPFPLWWLWQDGHLQRSLWDACQALVRRERRPGTSSSVGVDAHRLLSYTLGGLHMLLSVQTVYLDLPRSSAEPH